MPAKDAINDKQQEPPGNAKLKKRRAAVEQSRRAVLRRQEKISCFRGRLDWQGDLDAMRNGL
jgi:hypothetical protein